MGFTIGIFSFFAVFSWSISAGFDEDVRLRDEIHPNRSKRRTVAEISPLIKAALTRNIEKARTLLAVDNVPVDKTDNQGNTALLWAASTENNAAMIALLLAYGAKPKHQNYKGQNALHIAIKANNKELILPLLEAGVYPFASDNRDQSPWSYAQKKRPEIYQIINYYLGKLMGKC